MFLKNIYLKRKTLAAKVLVLADRLFTFFVLDDNFFPNNICHLFSPLFSQKKEQQQGKTN